MSGPCPHVSNPVGDVTCQDQVLSIPSLFTPSRLAELTGFEASATVPPASPGPHGS